MIDLELAARSLEEHLKITRAPYRSVGIKKGKIYVILETNHFLPDFYLDFPVEKDVIDRIEKVE